MNWKSPKEILLQERRPESKVRSTPRLVRVETKPCRCAYSSAVV